MILGSGVLTLVGGAKTVGLPRIPANAVILLSVKSPLGTIGALRWSVSAGVGFTVTSASVLDTSTVGYVVVA